MLDRRIAARHHKAVYKFWQVHCTLPRRRPGGQGRRETTTSLQLYRLQRTTARTGATGFNERCCLKGGNLCFLRGPAGNKARRFSTSLAGLEVRGFGTEYKLSTPRPFDVRRNLGDPCADRKKVSDGLRSAKEEKQGFGRCHRFRFPGRRWSGALSVSKAIPGRSIPALDTSDGKFTGGCFWNRRPTRTTPDFKLFTGLKPEKNDNVRCSAMGRSAAATGWQARSEEAHSRALSSKTIFSAELQATPGQAAKQNKKKKKKYLPVRSIWSARYPF